MNRLALLLLTLLSTSQPLYAAAPLTVGEAVTAALKNHPQITETRENLNGAEARTIQALANYYPQVSIVADWSKGRSFLTPLESIRQTEVNSETLCLGVSSPMRWRCSTSPRPTSG